VRVKVGKVWTVCVEVSPTTSRPQTRLDKKLEETQQKLQVQVQEIKKQAKTQAIEMEKVRKECQKKYEQLKQKRSTETAAEIRQIRSSIDKKQEIWENELIGLKGTMESDNKR
jgi:molecular chaperone GrpE (heat shock protein)